MKEFTKKNRLGIESREIREIEIYEEGEIYLLIGTRENYLTWHDRKMQKEK